MCDVKGCGTEQGSAPTIKVADETKRLFLKGMVALPLAAVLADPLLAQSAGERMQTVTITLPDGRTAQADLALPQKAEGPLPAVILIHEWWGLNNQIRAVANELAQAGFMALAVDLYNGEAATTREDAERLRKAMDPAWATAALVGWASWLRAHARSNGRVGTLGWCFGGGWSLDASLATPIDATVIYYGDVKRTEGQLLTLAGPVLGHFGTLDKRINAEMVGFFEREMAKAAKTDLTVHWYTADHAFANPTGARYDEDDAALAWARTMAFLHRHLS